MNSVLDETKIAGLNTVLQLRVEQARQRVQTSAVDREQRIHVDAQFDVLAEEIDEELKAFGRRQRVAAKANPSAPHMPTRGMVEVPSK